MGQLVEEAGPCALPEEVGWCRQKVLTLNMTAQLAWYMA